MKYSFRMYVGNSIQNFFEDNFDFLLIGFVFFIGDEFFQIVVVEIEDNLKHLFFGSVHDIEKGNNIGMFFESFEERYLSKC